MSKARIKISYSINLDEFFQELYGILGSVDFEKLEGLFEGLRKEIQTAGSLPSIEKSLNEVELIRDQLINIDFRLNDVGELLRQYKETLMPTQSSEGKSTEDSS